MAVEADEAKQLDSVTDNVQEQEVDATKAQQAMSVLSHNRQESSADSSRGDSEVKVSKDDVALIVSELEVTEEAATQALREVAAEAQEGSSPLKAALKKLVTA